MIFEPENLQVHNKFCEGCIAHNKDIMVSFDISSNQYIHDLFLTTEQAERLIILLQQKLQENKKDV